MLPADVEREIVASLAADREPDESWRDRHDGDWECRYVSVHGESFANPDGVSRQEILRRAKTGAAAFLIPEPTNRFDPDAVAVYVDLGNGETGQIGYLPRGTALGDSVGGGNAVWLAHKRRASGTDHLGATLYMVRT